MVGGQRLAVSGGLLESVGGVVLVGVLVGVVGLGLGLATFGEGVGNGGVAPVGELVVLVVVPGAVVAGEPVAQRVVGVAFGETAFLLEDGVGTDLGEVVQFVVLVGECARFRLHLGEVAERVVGVVALELCAGPDALGTHDIVIDEVFGEPGGADGARTTVLVAAPGEFLAVGEGDVLEEPLIVGVGELALVGVGNAVFLSVGGVGVGFGLDAVEGVEGGVPLGLGAAGLREVGEYAGGAVGVERCSWFCCPRH